MVYKGKLKLQVVTPLEDLIEDNTQTPEGFHTRKFSDYSINGMKSYCKGKISFALLRCYRRFYLKKDPNGMMTMQLANVPEPK
ncbi:hypothetical protein TNCV_2947771 [Trichonephila clavipes]|nr:hypothetical protein TNCV_2947771 [Trichonephila clavipes]